MDKVSVKVTVFFDEPFWAGVFERIDSEKLTACKVVFGAEPGDDKVQELLLENYYNLKFSPSVEVLVKKQAANPKRVQREARKQTFLSGISTKSQQALSLQREEMSRQRKETRKERRKAVQEYRYELKQKKRKQKHRGR
ncbi:MAG: YjdF family protein [Lachnospiraceae bacterium]|nr:YjdF family protein [Lachnospiraceae bacterium]